MTALVVAIDGPSGTGKSTISRRIAAEFGLAYLDTGAMYRAVTLHCMDAGVNLADARAVAAVLPTLKLEVELVPDGPVKVRAGGRDVTALIRTPEVTRNIRYVADVPEVRHWLVQMQRVIGHEGDLVTEGRDQGTVVFPSADLKVYLVASAEVRARRRFEELSAKGTRTSMQEVLADVRQRDHADMTRPVGALRKAEDAIEVDTSDMTPDEVAEKIVALARQKLVVATRKVDRLKLGLEPGPNH